MAREFSETFLFVALLAKQEYEGKRLSVWALHKLGHNTVILQKNARTGIGSIHPGSRLLMRRSSRPIIITLAHPENRRVSSYLLASAAKI